MTLFCAWTQFRNARFGRDDSKAERMLMRLAFLLFASWCVAWPQEKKVPMIAVIPFTSRTVDTEALEGISSALSSELLNTGKVRVMERDQMAQILKEQSFQNSGACDGGECAVEIGKLLSVDQMIVGSIARVGNTYSVTARQVRVESGEIVRSVTHNTRAEVDAILTDIVPVMARELAEQKVPGSSLSASTTDSSSAQPLPPVVANTGETAASRESEPSSKPDGIERKRVVWPWIAGGVVLVGGGVAAAVLLSNSSSGGSESEPPPVTDGSWNTTVRWP